VQGSASECVLISMLVARHAALTELKLNSPNVDEGILLSRLVAYCSKLVRTPRLDSLAIHRMTVTLFSCSISMPVDFCRHLVGKKSEKCLSL